MVLGEIQHTDVLSGSFQDAKGTAADRYIPARSSVNDTAKLKLGGENLRPENEYEELLATNLLGPQEQSKVLSYCEKPPKPEEHDTLKVLYSVGREATGVKAKITRVTPKEPMKTLDAPDLLDDF